MNESKRLIINVRTETVHIKPMFKPSLLKRRCIIHANAFFEWKAEESKKVKQRISKNEESIWLDSTTDLYMLKSIITMPRFVNFDIKPVAPTKKYNLFDLL